MSKIAFIYPGQGAQVCGMGQDFYEQTKEGKETFDLATDILGFSVPELCFTENDRLDITEYTQAAMVTTSIAMTKVLEAQGVKPDVTAGLSLGEYCAIASAGGMSTENAITTVRKRGILMQNAVPGGQGAMAAVLGLDAGKIEEVLADRSGVMIANYNCPGQIVISGSNKGIETACQKLTEAGAKRVLPLKVGGAFHSPLMEPARQELETAIKNTRFSTPVCPIYQNVDAQPYTDPAKIQENLIAQLTASVRWTQIMKNMIADGATSFLEIGPGKVLQGLLKKVSTEIETNGIQ